MRPTTTASNLFRRSICPGSARLEAGLPDDDSDFAREGQLLHDFCAHPEYQRGTLKPNQQDLLSLADKLKQEVIDQVESENDLNGKQYHQFIERQFNDDPVPGKPDLVRYYDQNRYVLVIDVKTGYNVVERAEINLQLRVYATLSWLETIEGKAAFVAIIQPRAPYAERKTLAKYEPEDIKASREQILSILSESEKPDAPLIPGDEQCRYCKAKLICTAFQSAIQVPTIIAPDKALSKTAREAYLEQKLVELNNEQLEKVVAAVRLADMIHDQALDEVRRRGGTEHLEVGKESEVRNITDVRKALALLSLAGMDRGDIFDCIKKLSLSDLGDKLRKLHPNWSWQETKDWINKKLSSVIELEVRKGRVISK